MTITYKKLLEITTIPTDSSAVYTAGANDAHIMLIVIHNSNTTAEAVKLWIVPNGGGVGDTNRIYSQTLPAGATDFIEFPVPGYILDTAGDKVHGDTDTASKVTISIMGGENS